METSVDIDCPLCTCGMSCLEKITKKEGKNHGRYFYTCPNQQSGCGFFKWKDELQKAATKIKRKFESMKSDSESSSDERSIKSRKRAEENRARDLSLELLKDRLEMHDKLYNSIHDKLVHIEKLLSQDK